MKQQVSQNMGKTKNNKYVKSLDIKSFDKKISTNKK